MTPNLPAFWLMPVLLENCVRSWMNVFAVQHCRNKNCWCLEKSSGKNHRKHFDVSEVLFSLLFYVLCTFLWMNHHSKDWHSYSTSVTVRWLLTHLTVCSIQEWRGGEDFSIVNAIHLRVLTRSSFSIHFFWIAFYEILLWSILISTPTKENVFQEEGLHSLHQRLSHSDTLALSPRARRNMLCMSVSFMHLPQFYCFGFVFLLQSISLFSSFIPEKLFLHLFCAIEEGDTADSTPPWVRERSLSQLVCHSPVMSKRDKMKVGSVCHVLQPWEALWEKDNL